MQRRTGCAASVVVLVAGALVPWHDVSAQQSATAPPPPSQQESRTRPGLPIDIGTVPAEGRAATALTSPDEQWRHRKWDLVFDATTSPRSPALDERWPAPRDPVAWSMRARAQYKTPKSEFSVSLVGERGSQFPSYLTESLDAQGRYAISSGALRELSGRHIWDVAFRVDRRLAETRGGTTLDAFAQVFHPVGAKVRSGAETPIACSSALSFGVAIGF